LILAGGKEGKTGGVREKNGTCSQGQKKGGNLRGAGVWAKRWVGGKIFRKRKGRKRKNVRVNSVQKRESREKERKKETKTSRVKQEGESQN